MIIDFSNINGGGGGGYVLPVASQSTLGGVKVGSGLTINSGGTLSADAQPIGIATTAQTGVVKIGEGINVDSAGTISVTGSTGGGIEVVTELPSSGTDGQTVLLETIIPEKHIKVDGTGPSDLTTTVTATGITTKTLLFKYWYYDEYVDVFVNSDNSITLESEISGTSINVAVGETDSFAFVGNGAFNNSVTVVPSSTGCVLTLTGSCDKTNVTDIDQRSEEKQVLYTWSDIPLLTADVDYTSSTGNPWCVRFKYSEIPNNTTLVVWKYTYSEDYRHLVYENGQLHSYTSSSADTYTATTYVNIAQYGFVDGGRYGVVYWTDDEIIVYSNGNAVRVSINTDVLYKNGWHKEIEHKESNKAFYKDYVFYDGDFQIIIKNDSYKMYDVGFKLNPSTQYNTPFYVYSKNNSTIGPFFAPTTTGSTGQVCIAGNGWATPTWTNPENLTNGVKFWKGTLDEYEAIGEGNYDANTLYICTDE